VTFENLFASVESGDLAGVRQIISTDPAAIGARNAEGLSPIVFAMYWGRHDIVKELLRAAPRLDLWEAATVGATARVGELINADPALVESRSPDGFTALHLAVFFGHPETARLLIEAGANVSARTTNALDNQPLHAATAGNRTDARLAAVQLLLDAGAPVNERQSGGFTPVMSAAQNGDAPVLDLLLARGADPTLKDDEGRSAADHARTAGHETLAERLVGLN
jgi:ankyrin repeat protein